MKRLIEAREEPIEELFSRLWSHLAEIEKVGWLGSDIRAGYLQDSCRRAFDVVGRLQDRLIFQRR